mgnify:CR=1 FL=1
MSKIKVDTIESSNQNVKLAPNGTGVVEVKGAGGADGTLKLVSSNGSNAVKIKSPPHSSGQSATLVLPDNQPVTDKYLKVKSITGSGATAVGQLEYGDIPTADLTQLNANDISSGVIPSSRFPASQSASQGAGLKLVSKTVNSTTGVASITISIPSQQARFLLIGKRMTFSNNTSPAIEFLDTDGNIMQHTYLEMYGGSNTNNHSTTAMRTRLYTNADGEDFGFIFDFSSDFNHSSLFGMVMRGDAQDSTRLRFTAFVNSGTGTVHSLRFTPNQNSGSYPRTIEPNTEILLYQYIES